MIAWKQQDCPRCDDPIFDTDVLSPDEQAADWYGIPLNERPVEFDPDLVATVAALQNGGAA